MLQAQLAPKIGGSLSHRDSPLSQPRDKRNFFSERRGGLEKKKKQAGKRGQRPRQERTQESIHQKGKKKKAKRENYSKRKGGAGGKTNTRTSKVGKVHAWLTEKKTKKSTAEKKEERIFTLKE